jgi:hypothetical protein
MRAPSRLVTMPALRPEFSSLLENWIEGSEPPSPKKIRQIELIKRGTPVQNHSLQGDAEGAGRDPPQVCLFCCASQLPARQIVQREHGQRREKVPRKKPRVSMGQKI